jgi:hypothetical protein
MKLPWFKMFPTDWLSGEARLLCPEARALCVDMLCLMAKSDRYGYLSLGESPISVEQLARFAGIPLDRTAVLVEELLSAGVCSRDSAGFIFSRRLVREEHERQGNNKRASRFYKKEAGSNGHSNAHSNGDSNGIITPQKLEVRSQKEEKERRKPSRDEWLAYAKTLNGWNLTDAETAWDYYESNGWRIGGKAPVKDWQACARTCYRRAIQKPATPMGKPKVELGDNHRNSCYSPPTYKLAGFATREAWVQAGCP